MWNNFFKHIDIDPANVHILDGNAEDLEAECQAYEDKIAEAGGIEMFVGGGTRWVFCRILLVVDAAGIIFSAVAILHRCKSIHY